MKPRCLDEVQINMSRWKWWKDEMESLLINYWRLDKVQVKTWWSPDVSVQMSRCLLSFSIQWIFSPSPDESRCQSSTKYLTSGLHLHILLKILTSGHLDDKIFNEIWNIFLKWNHIWMSGLSMKIETSGHLDFQWRLKYSHLEILTSGLWIYFNLHLDSIWTSEFILRSGLHFDFI